MKIGIYKPFKKVFFHDDSADNAAWSYEIVHVAKILAEHGHEVSMLSQTDLQDGHFKGINRGSIDAEYDRIILFSGTFKEDEYGENVITLLREKTPRLDFMLTDLRLLPENKELYKLFDTIYTQATRILPEYPEIPAEKQVYGGVSEFLPYKYEYKSSVEDSLKNKVTEFYFGGTERGRLMDFIEYVWRPQHVVTTKTAFFNIDNRCTRGEYMQLLDGTKYSIVIADVDYNMNHFITPRPYEYFIHDIVCFTDNKFDPDYHLIPKDSWLRVNNYRELREKMNYLNAHPEKHKELIEWGRAQLTPTLISGEYVYDKIR